jgi:predicted nuclease of predicted toxin-antitoxin system
VTRLLLDEHVSPLVARVLCEQGFDVVACGVHESLKRRADVVLFAGAPDQRRAIVTRDVADFRPLLHEAIRAGTPTYGLICLSRAVSLRRDAAGALAARLAALLRACPEDDAIVSRFGGEHWL